MNAASPVPSKQDNDDDEIDLGQLLRSLWRGKAWITGTAILVAIVGIYYSTTVTPLYTTTTAVLKETSQEQVVDFSGALGGALAGGLGVSSEVNTEIEVLRSRNMLEKLVIELDLTRDPEFNPALLPSRPISISAVINSGRQLLGLPIPVEKPLNVQETLDATVDTLKRTLFISNIPSSNVYELRSTTEYPEKSALIANSLAELYIRNQLDIKNEANLAATEWLANRVSQLGIDLENAATAAKEFSANTDLINANTLSALSRQVKELRERLDAVRESKIETTAFLELLLTMGSGNDLQLMAEVANDRELNGLLTSLSTDTAASRSIFDERFTQIVSQTELELRRQEVQIAALEQSIQQQEDATDQQSDDLLTLQQLQREVNASEILYEYFLSRLKETAIQSDIQTPESRVLSRAVVPQLASSPNKRLIAILSLFLGAFAGIAVIIVRQAMRNTFRSAQELQQKTGYSILGQISKMPRPRRNKLTEDLSHTLISEAGRNIRMSVLLSDADNPPQVIMSTSSIPGEDKIEQSFLLVQHLAGLGKKVLLVEGDLRKRGFAAHFDSINNTGLLAVLAGKETLENAVVFQEGLKADVLMCEKPTDHAADILSSEGFEKFVAKMRKTYDYIVVDAPPALAVADACIIGRLADTTIYTVRWNHTTHHQVADGLKILEDVHVKISGLVLSQINLKRQNRFGHGEPMKYYQSYYSK